MLKEVETFIAARQKAEDTYNADYRALDREVEGNVRGLAYMERDPVYKRFDARYEEVRSAYSAARLAAWKELGKSEDNLVAWMAVNCRDYAEHAIEILRVLPAPVSALRKIADDQGWCAVFDTFLIKARRAGVVDSAGSARMDMEEWVLGLAWSRARVRQLMELVDKVVAEEAGAFVAACGTPPKIDAANVA